jgi:hypothetical protein
MGGQCEAANTNKELSMIKARHVLTTIAGFVALTALAPHASARIVVQCNSDTWFNNQLCSYGEDSALLQGRTSTVSNSLGTLHTITLSLPTAPPVAQLLGLAVALDRNGSVVNGSSITSTGSAQSRNFTTPSSNPPRRVQTSLDSLSFSLTRLAYTQDTWGAGLDTRFFNDITGALRGQCHVTSSSTGTTFHAMTAQVIHGNACTGFALSVSGQTVFSVQDANLGDGAQSNTTTTTPANRPRLVKAVAF